MKITNFKLAIGIPCTWGNVPFPFFLTFIQMDKPDFSLIPMTNGPIDELRNSIVEETLRQGCSHLLMIDVDQTYPKNLIPRLLERNLSVVGAVVHRRYPPFDPLLMRGGVNERELVTDFEYGDLVKVDATGTGCLLIQSWVFNEISKPWFEFIPNPDEEVGGVVGEDFNFCDKLTAAGIDIYVDTGIECGHLSTMEIKKETHLWYRQVLKARNQEIVTK